MVSPLNYGETSGFSKQKNLMGWSFFILRGVQSIWGDLPKKVVKEGFNFKKSNFILVLSFSQFSQIFLSHINIPKLSGERAKLCEEDLIEKIGTTQKNFMKHFEMN